MLQITDKQLMVRVGLGPGREDQGCLTGARRGGKAQAMVGFGFSWPSEHLNSLGYWPCLSFPCLIYRPGRGSWAAWMSWFLCLVPGEEQALRYLGSLPDAGVVGLPERAG